MDLVFLDLETKQSFADIAARDPGKLGVSVVGVYQKELGLKAFFEKDFPRLWPVLEKADQVVGFNILKFDWPALNPYYPGDLLKLPTLDLLEIVSDSLGRRIRLDNLAQATLGEGKSATGWDAIRFWQTGELEKLAEYCLQDVVVTRDLYHYGQKNGAWRYTEPPDEVREFVIKWPLVEKKAGVDLTLGI